MIISRFRSFLILLIVMSFSSILCAQTVVVSWDANSEPDLKGYKVYYGTASRNYDHVIDVGNVTEKQIANLTWNTTYYFAVTAYDTAYNESDFSQEVSITLTDTTQNQPPPPVSDPPIVTDVVLLNRQTIKVYFNQRMDATSLTNSANYVISPGIQIIAISPDPSLMFVEITTSTHTIETEYTLTIRNVMNQDGIPLSSDYQKTYYFPDTQPPFVTGIQLLDLQHIQISFSEPMDQNSVQTIANYLIQPAVQIHGVQTDATGTKVILNTAEHSSATTYLLTVQNVRDRRGNQLPNSFTVSYSFIEQTPPQVVSAEALNKTTLVLFFSKKMDYASVSNKSNYFIQPGISILDLIVDPSLQKVTLRTQEHQPIITYKLTVRNVMDFSQIPMSAPYEFQYSFQAEAPLTPPATPAMVTDVIPVGLQTLRIYFNQQMDPVSATNPANYRISPAVQIMSIKIDTSKMFVILTTAQHQIGQQYQIEVQNVKNISDLPLAQTFQFTYTIQDSEPPFVSGIFLSSVTSIQVVFNEPVDPQTASDIQNYSIQPQVAIRSIALDQTGARVTLTTDAHSVATTYVLTIRNIRDRQGNGSQNPFAISYSFADQTPPEVVQVQTLDRSTLLVIFSKKMDYSSVRDKNNYQIQPDVNILDIIPDTSLTHITLRTAEHLAQIEYVLTIDGIKDFSQLPMAAPFQFSYQFSDDSPPYVEKMELISLSQLRLYFSEPIDSALASDPGSYRITPAKPIFKAVVDTNWRIVDLYTGEHDYGVRQELEIRDIQDLARNTIPSPYIIEYEFRRPAAVDSISRQGYQASVVAVGDQYYTDREYKIAELPQELENLTWIKTQNNDKFSTGLHHLSFKVAENVTVYLGYDERNATLPPWMTDWERTDLVIRDDQNATFRCYKKNFTPGTVTLGGNYGSDQTNMYVVLVRALSHWIRYPEKPTGPREDTAALKFELLQNYPNPFNPITEIPLLARESGKVTIIIYDLLGRVVRRYDLDVVAGARYRVVWDSRDEYGIPVSSGLYICRLIASDFQISRKMMLVR